MKIKVKTIYRSCCATHKVKYVFKGDVEDLKLFFKQNFLNRVTPHNLSIVEVWLPPEIKCKVVRTNVTDSPNIKQVKDAACLDINASGEWSIFKKLAEDLNETTN